MKTLSRFVAKFTSLIVAVLSCFDRVIFKGYLPITNGPALEGFVDHVLKIRRCDFMAFAEEQSETLVDHAKRLAQEAGAEYRFLQGKHRKDKLVDEILRQRPITRGLDLRPLLHGMLPQLQARLRQGSPALGQRTPATARLVLLLPRSRTGPDPHPPDDLVPVHRPGLRQRPLLAGSADAQATAGVHPARQRLHGLWTIPKPLRNWPIRSPSQNWPKILNRLVRQVNPLMNERWFRGLSYYWVVDQAEYATDLIFTSREALAGLYPRLLDHAAVNFSAKDILTLLGPTVPSPVRGGGAHALPERSLARGHGSNTG